MTKAAKEVRQAIQEDDMKDEFFLEEKERLSRSIHLAGLEAAPSPAGNRPSASRTIIRNLNRENLDLFKPLFGNDAMTAAAPSRGSTKKSCNRPGVRSPIITPRAVPVAPVPASGSIRDHAVSISPNKAKRKLHSTAPAKML